MVNKVFYIPNLKINCSQPKEFQVRQLCGITCFIDSANINLVQHSITNDLFKSIIIKVFEIGERLKDAGRFEGKTLDDMYSLRSLGGKELLSTDEDYIKWSGINPDSFCTLSRHVKEFMINFGMLNLWPVIDRIMLVGNKENFNVHIRNEEGGILEVNDRWGYYDGDGYHEVQPLMFIMEYIARLYLHHTRKDETYSFSIDLSCRVNYLGEKYDMGFLGYGLNLLIDLAYLHTVADLDAELSKCECGKWFYRNLLKEQKHCNKACTSRWGVRRHRNLKKIKLLLEEGKSLSEISLIIGIDMDSLVKQLKESET